MLLSANLFVLFCVSFKLFELDDGIFLSLVILDIYFLFLLINESSPIDLNYFAFI